MRHVGAQMSRRGNRMSHGGPRISQVRTRNGWTEGRKTIAIIYERIKKFDGLFSEAAFNECEHKKMHASHSWRWWSTGHPMGLCGLALSSEYRLITSGYRSMTMTSWTLNGFKSRHGKTARRHSASGEFFTELIFKLSNSIICDKTYTKLTHRITLGLRRFA